MTRWFRMYDELLDDPKVQTLPAEVFRGWVNVLCLASRHDGTLPHLSDLAFSLRLSEEAASVLVGELTEVGLLDATDSGLEPHRWGNRQYSSDLSSDRVRAFRERKRNGDETVMKRKDETAMKRPTRADARSVSVSESDSVSVSSGSGSGSGGEEESFALLWAAYPRHEAKKPARKAFGRIGGVENGTLAAMLSWIDVAKRSLQWQDGTKIPHLATWLNQERWKDDPPPEGVMNAAARTTHESPEQAKVRRTDEAARRILARFPEEAGGGLPS